MKDNWMPILGRMKKTKDSLVFKGGKIPIEGEDREGSEIGLFICDQTFAEGTISVDVKFKGVSQSSCADIVLYYDPQNKYTHVSLQ